jgi:cobalt-zinc-cadmium efflux system membrane fusion protein
LDDMTIPLSPSDSTVGAHHGGEERGLTKRGHRLSLPAQGLFLAIGGATIATLLLVLPDIAGMAATGSEAAEDAGGAAFRPTDQQWAGLKIKHVVRQPIVSVVETEGRIATDDDLNTPVFSPYSGRVTVVHARVGDVVKAGTPLFTVQSSELAQAQNDLVSGLAALRTAHAQLDLATMNEKRQHELYLGHGAAQRDWQQSAVDLATARGGLSTASIAVAAVRNRLAILGLSAADIQTMQTATNPGMGAADTIVRAPIGGTVTQRQISLGQNIVGSVASQGSSGAVFTIGNLSRVWMVAYAAESDAAHLHVGDSARVTVAAYPGRIFESRLTYVAPVIDPITHRLLVRSEVANPDGALKPDMLAQFEIVTGAAAPVMAVPASAVVYDGAEAHVWLADPTQRTLAIRQVILGAESRGAVEIREGLREGDDVVTSGAVFIDRTLSGS